MNFVSVNFLVIELLKYRITQIAVMFSFAMDPYACLIFQLFSTLNTISCILHSAHSAFMYRHNVVYL